MKNRKFEKEERSKLSTDGVTISVRIMKDTNNKLEKLSTEFEKSKSEFLRIIIENVIKDPIYYEMMLCGGIGYLLERLDPVEFERELPYFLYGKLREKKSDEKIHFLLGKVKTEANKANLRKIKQSKK